MFLSSFESDLCIVIYYGNQCHKNQVARIFSVLVFHFCNLGPVQTGRPPPGRGGGWESESLRVFNTRQESGNGTRELRTGSRSVPQYGARIRDWGPALAAIAMSGGRLNGQKNSTQRPKNSTHWHHRSDG